MKKYVCGVLSIILIFGLVLPTYAWRGRGWKNDLGSVTAGNIKPSKDDTFDLGSSTRKWKDLYVDGTVYTDDLSVSGGNERVTFTTYGEYIGQDTDDMIDFVGVNGTSDTSIRMDLDGTPEILSRSGTLILGGYGNTNNENLSLDFETSGNRVSINSTSGVEKIKPEIEISFQDNASITNDKNFNFGSLEIASLCVETIGNDNLQMGLMVNDTTYSGYFSLMEKADMGNANRSPSSVTLNPTLRVYSADETVTGDYIEMYHNQTDGVIDVGSGNLNLVDSATGDVTCFEGTDVGDTEDGKRFTIYRKAAEGDAKLELYFDSWNTAYITTNSYNRDLKIETGTGKLHLNPNAKGDLGLFALSSSGDNKTLQMYGYITAGSAAKYVQYQINDTTDNFELTREDSYIGNFDIQMPLKISSSQKVNVTTVNAATYDLLTSDYILNVTYTSTGAVTSLTLPTAQAESGRIIVVKDAGGNAGTNNITIDTEGSETIDGAATKVLSTDYESVSLYCDGSNWFTY